MPTSQDFTYDQPTRDALAGIYVEASDGTPGVSAHVSAAGPREPVGQPLPRPEALFGLTLTVVDDPASERSKIASS